MSIKSLLERHNKLVDIAEEIKAEEAHTEKGSLKTLLQGKRNVAFLCIDEKLRRFLEKRKFQIILVRRLTNKFWMGIVHNEKGMDDARELFKIARSKGGFLNDRTSDEAYKIGKLLGYSNSCVNEYISRHYKSKTPLRIDDESDYDDLFESKKNIKKISDLMRKINAYTFLYSIFF